MSNERYKFRAWDIEEKIMCPVSIINFEKGCFLLGNSPTPISVSEDLIYYGIPEGHFVHFENLILMQYSGLKDINGVEIYEGDILKGVLPKIVVWGKMVRVNYGHGDSDTTIYIGFNFSNWGNQESDVLKNLEVIGSIYEHPNLLKNE